MELYSKFNDEEKESYNNNIERMLQWLVIRDDFKVEQYESEEQMSTDFYFYLTHEYIDFSMPPRFLGGSVSMKEFLSDANMEEIKSHLVHAFNKIYKDKTLAQELELDIALPVSGRKLLPSRYVGAMLLNDQLQPFEKDILFYIQNNRNALIKVRVEQDSCDKCSSDYYNVKMASYHLPLVNEEEMVELLTENYDFSIEEAQSEIKRSTKESNQYILYDYGGNETLHYRRDWVELVGKDNADIAQFSLQIFHCEDCGAWNFCEHTF